LAHPQPERASPYASSAPKQKKEKKKKKTKTSLLDEHANERNHTREKRPLSVASVCGPNNWSLSMGQSFAYGPLKLDKFSSQIGQLDERTIGAHFFHWASLHFSISNSISIS